MNERISFTELTAFLAVVRHQSFRKAADEMGLAPSSLSHIMRSVESRLGIRLLNRTTRSVATTEAGQRLYERLRPLLQDLNSVIDEVDDFKQSPSGTVRINTSAVVTSMLLEKVVPGFLSRYPEMSIDLVCEDRLVDIVAEGFDAGIRFRESVPQDMIVVPFGGRTRFVAVASPSYLRNARPILTPDDLSLHRCIRHRMPSGKLYRWEFEKRGEEMVVDVAGSITLDSIPMMIQAAEAGLGIAYVPFVAASKGLAEERLERVLDDWCPEFDGLCLHYPGHRHVPAGLRAFIAALKEWA
ncbi:MAG TPA: LysR substrate-binding domain-containing protein [Pseudorhizobium sp.]|nr:LysR substrate-binding domain-containing protein [Pseudorhizobium sp.]